MKDCYPSESKYGRRGVSADMDDAPRKPASEPTPHPPGTVEKMKVMSQRLQNGEELYHPQDADMTVARGIDLRPFCGVENYRGSGEYEDDLE